MIKIRICEENFDVSEELASLSKLGGGAVASFIGLVRGDGSVIGLELEHYPVMTEKVLGKIAAVAESRWLLHGVTIIHRVGKLHLGEQIVLVCTASDHRHAALEACSYVIDRLKTDAPFWKKELGEDGSGEWVEERQMDIETAASWQGGN